MIMDLLADPDAEQKHQNLDINVIGCLAQILTQPYLVYHKKFIAQNAMKIAEMIKARLISAPEKALKNVRKENVDAIIKSIENITLRHLDKAEREQQSEILRLQLCQKSLVSDFLERKIQGMKDMNMILRNNTVYVNTTKTFTVE